MATHVESVATHVEGVTTRGGGATVWSGLFIFHVCGRGNFGHSACHLATVPYNSYNM